MGFSINLWVLVFHLQFFSFNDQSYCMDFKEYLGERKLEEKIQIRKIKQLKRKYKLLKDRIGKVFNEAHVKRL